jgi:hypothetical protein
MTGAAFFIYPFPSIIDLKNYKVINKNNLIDNDNNKCYIQ